MNTRLGGELVYMEAEVTRSLVKLAIIYQGPAEKYISLLCLRFYMVTGEKGWLPYGTDCSGEDKREAYCVKVGEQLLGEQV